VNCLSKLAGLKSAVDLFNQAFNKLNLKDVSVDCEVFPNSNSVLEQSLFTGFNDINSTCRPSLSSATPGTRSEKQTPTTANRSINESVLGLRTRNRIGSDPSSFNSNRNINNKILKQNIGSNNNKSDNNVRSRTNIIKNVSTNYNNITNTNDINNIFNNDNNNNNNSNNNTNNNCNSNNNTAQHSNLASVSVNPGVPILIQAVPKTQYIFVSRLLPNYTHDDIKRHLDDRGFDCDKNGIQIFKINKTKHSTYSSFKLGVPENLNLADKVLDSSI